MTSPSYTAVHRRLVRRRGPARGFPCSVPGCSRQAGQWAWLRTGPSNTGVGSAGQALTWGTNVEDYAPMCVSHSLMMDRGGSLTHCPGGHERTPENTNTRGVCRICANARKLAAYHQRKAS